MYSTANDFPTSLGEGTVLLPPETNARSGNGAGIKQDADCEQRVARQLDELTKLLAVETDFVVEDPLYDLPSEFLLSVVIPVFNEETTIRELLARVHALPLPLEIVVVDDHSSDRTPDELRRWQGVENVKVVCHEKNLGKGAALRTGFEAATGEIVVIQDADLEYDPRDILKLLQPILDGQADTVYGSRFLENQQQDPSCFHRLANHMLTMTSNLATGLRLTDMETCYKAFRREVIRDLPIRQNRFGFEPEVTAKLARRGIRLREVPVNYHPRSRNEGKKIGWRDGLNALFCIARYAVAD